MACSGPAPLTPQDAPGNDSPVLTIGVVSDTHIPDRVHSLHPGIVPALRAAGVKHILHAGDICLRGVLDELSSLAPVTAARGNRDLLLTGLRMVEHLELGGARIALLHGHCGLGPYLLDKINCILQVYQLERYLSRILRQVGSQAQVIVFGHTRYPVLTHYAGQL